MSWLNGLTLIRLTFNTKFVMQRDKAPKLRNFLYMHVGLKGSTFLFCVYIINANRLKKNYFI